jgi:hypothetical protein
VRSLARFVYAVKGSEEVEVFLGFLEHEVGTEAKQIMTSYAEQLIQQGIDRGEVAGERKLLLKQLRQRFGALDAATLQRIESATMFQPFEASQHLNVAGDY